MTKTPQEVMDFQAELEAELDGHTNSKEWEDERLGNYDALEDILQNKDPYNFDHLKETIMKYMGYLRAMEWYEGEGRHPPGWRFWDEWVGSTYNKYWVWKCPDCGSHRIEIRGHNLWTADQDENGEVQDRGWDNLVQMIASLHCSQCGEHIDVVSEDQLEVWHDKDTESPRRRR